jgi:uncharacterized protein
MESQERDIIDGLFGRLRQAESQGVPRDREAETHIANLVRQQPAAPYYMTQAIVVQEQALQAAQSRIQQLEQELAQRPAAGSGGGFLSGLFGGGSKPATPTPTQRQPMTMGGMGNPQAQPYGNNPWGQQPMAGAGPWNQRPGGGGGGGFMSGALQTAMGVAGGVVVGSMIADMLTPDAAHAAPAPEPEPSHEPEPAEEDFGGDDFSMDDEI